MKSLCYFSENLIIPEIALNVYTTKYQAYQINKIIKTFIPTDSVVTDATAGIGGNSLFFIKDFRRVNLIEKDPDMYKILIKNTKLENRVNISSYNCSYNYIKFMLIQDLVFFDPPWGGQDYKNKKKINLFLDGINVIDIINDIYNFTKIVALKIPNNFDTSRFDNSFWYNKIFNIVKGKKTVYKLIIFYKPI